MRAATSNRIGASPRRFGIGIAILTVGLATAPLAGRAGADSGSRRVAGSITSHIFSGAGCASPVNLCARGDITGSINGPLDLVVQTLTPTPRPNIALATASVVFHDRHGNLSCDETFVLNTTPGSDAEFAALCEVTGGTGEWSGASGYIEGAGITPPGAPATSALVAGKVILP